MKKLILLAMLCSCQLFGALETTLAALAKNLRTIAKISEQPLELKSEADVNRLITNVTQQQTLDQDDKQRMLDSLEKLGSASADPNLQKTINEAKQAVIDAAQRTSSAQAEGTKITQQIIKAPKKEDYQKALTQLVTQTSASQFSAKLAGSKEQDIPTIIKKHKVKLDQLNPIKDLYALKMAVLKDSLPTKISDLHNSIVKITDSVINNRLGDALKTLDTETYAFFKKELEGKKTPTDQLITMAQIILLANPLVITDIITDFEKNRTGFSAADKYALVLYAYEHVVELIELSINDIRKYVNKKAEVPEGLKKDLLRAFNYPVISRVIEQEAKLKGDTNFVNEYENLTKRLLIIFDKEETKDALKAVGIDPETILSIFKEKTKERVWCITENTPELPYIHFNNDLQDIANEINKYNANKLKMLDVEKNALRVRIIKEINEFVINAFQTKCDTCLHNDLNRSENVPNLQTIKTFLESELKDSNDKYIQAARIGRNLIERMRQYGCHIVRKDEKNQKIVEDSLGIKLKLLWQ